MRHLLHWFGAAPDKEPTFTEAEHTHALAVNPAATPALSGRVMSLVNELQQFAPQHTEDLLSQMRKALRSDATETDRYNAAEALSTAVYPKFKFSEFGRLFLEDQAFLSYYERFMDAGNWHSLDRKYTLDQLLKIALTAPGDFVECGVYKGMTAYLMCQALQGKDKKAHLFDSFVGLSAPGELDGSYWVAGALSAPESVLRETLGEFDNYRVYRGWIPERFEEVAGNKFSLVHVDVDLYQPTRDALEFFYPRTSRGGIILMDDYGFITCPGAKRAADEFFASKPEPILMLTTGQALVIRQ